MAKRRFGIAQHCFTLLQELTFPRLEHSSLIYVKQKILKSIKYFLKKIIFHLQDLQIPSQSCSSMLQPDDAFSSNSIFLENEWP